MVIIKNRTLIENFGPIEITPENVQYYCAHARELRHTQVHKAQLFAKNDCIKYAGNGIFICEPLQGYNSTTYTIIKSAKYFDTFECNCQAWVTKHRKDEIIEQGANCSHILALFFCFKMKKEFAGFEDINHNISLPENYALA